MPEKLRFGGDAQGRAVLPVFVRVPPAGQDVIVPLLFFHQGKFLWQVKISYTVGYSVSLVSLITAIVILCIFR